MDDFMAFDKKKNRLLGYRKHNIFLTKSVRKIKIRISVVRKLTFLI